MAFAQVFLQRFEHSHAKDMDAHQRTSERVRIGTIARPLARRMIVQFALTMVNHADKRALLPIVARAKTRRVECNAGRLAGDERKLRGRPLHSVLGGALR